jgi:meiotic recombination protein REC8
MARFTSSTPLGAAVVSALAFLAAIPAASAANSTNSTTRYVEGTDANGVTRLLADSRYPALYTGDFGDCMAGESLLNVTSFDAAYYADNMTVLFHLTGSTNLNNDSIMMYINVDAYGEDRFDLTFNPCNANIYRQVLFSFYNLHKY